MRPSRDVRAILDKTLKRRDGAVLNIFRTMAKHPRLLKRFNLLGGLLLSNGVLPPRSRELVILRVAVRTGSDYEFGQHRRIGSEHGITDEELARVQEADLTNWPTGDGILLEFTDELVAMHRVCERTWAAAEELFNEVELIELVILVGFYVMTAGFLNTVQVELEPGVQGF